MRGEYIRIVNEKQIIEEAQWYIDHKSSVRDVAENFMVSKSKIHYDFTKRLKYIDPDLYVEVKALLRYNKEHATAKMNESNRMNRISQYNSLW